MSLSELFFVFSPNAALTGVIWFFILSSMLYIARLHAHRAILSATSAMHKALRLSARSVLVTIKRFNIRNEEVLLLQGREAAERIIEREFDRVDATVRKDLAEYPALHRYLSEEITKIDEDFQESIDVPPAPPGWVKAVEAVAKIPAAKGDPMVANVLEDIHQSLIKANTKATEEYRSASHKRHQYLTKMMPHWRKIKQVLTQVDKNVNSLLVRSTKIDMHMDEFEGVMRQSDRSVRTLSSSSLTQFFISAFVLVIAVGGAVINFHLIARPMSEMVGGSSILMGFKMNTVAALVIILVELAMGLFLMETMRITRLFPVIGALNDKTRVRMMWAFFTILFILASVEAGLALMREWLVEGDELTKAYLRGESAAMDTGKDSYLWITTVAQMGLGFILPFALMFVAIPLETFVHSTRTVLGVLMVGMLRSLVWLLRFVGATLKFSGTTFIYTYDLIIFAPLGIERLVKNIKKSDDKEEASSIGFGGKA
jgi:hypothetical protein